MYGGWFLAVYHILVMGTEQDGALRDGLEDLVPVSTGIYGRYVSHEALCILQNTGIFNRK